MKNIKILKALSLIALINVFFAVKADELIMTVHTLEDAYEKEKASARFINIDDSDEIPVIRTRDLSTYADKDIIKLDVSALDRNGNLTEGSIKNLLTQAYSDGRISNPAFQYADALTVKDIKQTHQGHYTEQLFWIESSCAQAGEHQFILKGIVDTEEIGSLLIGSRYEHFEPIIHPHTQEGFPQILFPIAYFSYQDQNKKKRSLSLMHVASGNQVKSYLIKFAQSNEEEREKMHAQISQAYFEVGAQMARFYKRYAISNPRFFLMGIRHGDFHPGNIFFDPATKQVTLIDNNRIATSIGKPENVCRDFVWLLVRTKPISVPMTDRVYEEWFMASAPSLIMGLLSIYSAADQIRVLEEIEKTIETYEKSENKKMRYKVGVVYQALHALGKNIKEYVHNSDVFKRIKKSMLARPLIAADIDINAKDKQGATALYEAAAHERLVLWPLIAAGADVNAHDNNLDTPLHNAVRSNKHRAVKILIEAGADIDARNRKGRTPLDEAMRNNNKEVIATLRMHGAKRGTVL